MRPSSLLCFSSAYDTHPKNTISFSNIVKFECATPKQFKKSENDINIPPNNCGKGGEVGTKFNKFKRINTKFPFH